MENINLMFFSWKINIFDLTRLSQCPSNYYLFIYLFIYLKYNVENVIPKIRIINLTSQRNNCVTVSIDKTFYCVLFAIFKLAKQNGTADGKFTILNVVLSQQC